jgi:Na+:H+ antiporter, NhaA family
MTADFRETANRLTGPFQRFTASEAAGGIVLMCCAVIALAIANSPWNDAYLSLLHHPLPAGWKSFAVELSLHEWINDGLMSLFFLLVGLEIKREMLIGELASIRNAALPIAGAIGGMLVPAVIYGAFNAGGPGAHGWGIPMATDIAFALGVVALLGPRVPVALKLFLTAVAIVDDIGAVVVIALFYTAQLSATMLAIAAVVMLALTILNLVGVRHPIPYILLGIVLWAAVLLSGIHATIAGVLLAMTIPARTHTEDEDSLLSRLEHALHVPVSFLIVPLFALTNAGVRVIGGSGSGISAAVAGGISVGLVVGKPLGITIASWLAVRARIAALPEGVSWRLLQSVSWLGGIGFTMSLFVGALAFDDPALLDSAKIGVLAASVFAATIGWLFLRRGATQK